MTTARRTAFLSVQDLGRTRTRPSLNCVGSYPDEDDEYDAEDNDDDDDGASQVMGPQRSALKLNLL